MSLHGIRVSNSVGCWGVCCSRQRQDNRRAEHFGSDKILPADILSIDSDPVWYVTHHRASDYFSSSVPWVQIHNKEQILIKVINMPKTIRRESKDGSPVSVEELDDRPSKRQRNSLAYVPQSH